MGAIYIADTNKHTRQAMRTKHGVVVFTNNNHRTNIQSGDAIADCLERSHHIINLLFIRNTEDHSCGAIHPKTKLISMMCHAA